MTARPSRVSMPGMMVWRGRFDGPMRFGWPGWTLKQLPRFWNITPVWGQRMPQPKES